MTFGDCTDFCRRGQEPPLEEKGQFGKMLGGISSERLFSAVVCCLQSAVFILGSINLGRKSRKPLSVRGVIM
jgi:hypothetical protein